MSDEIRTFRPINELEFRLYRDLTQPAVDWAEKNMTQEMEEAGPDYAPAELRQMVHQAQKRMEHFGFVMTNLGLMIRDEHDILDNQPAAVIEWSAAEANQQIDRIMRK